MFDVFLLTDSLALPRSKPESCDLRNTWPQLLRDSGLSVYQVSIGGATVEDLYKQYYYHSAVPARIFILQSGIVDCSPRFLSRNSTRFLQSTPLVGNRVLKFFNKPFVRRIRNLTYISPQKFSNYANKISNLKYDQVFSLGICCNNSGYEQILPRIMENVQSYNHILQQNFNDGYINLNNLEKSDFMSDFHHITESGHLKIANSILSRL